MTYYPAGPGWWRFASADVKIRELVTAVDHPSRAYGDQTLAALPAPVAFSRATVFQEPNHNPASAHIGVAPDLLRHAEHAWTIHAPLRGGNEYYVSPWAPGSEAVKSGRSGAQLRFVPFSRSIRTLSGDPVLDETMTVVAGAASKASAVTAVLPSTTPGLSTVPVTRDPTQVSAWSRAVPNDVLLDREIAPLTRSTIVRFAGALGDFTAVHHDPAAAARQGLPDVIAMGMLPAAIVLSFAEAALGPTAITTCRIRFQRAVFPGEPLVVRGECIDGAADATLAIRMVLRAANEPAVTVWLESDRTRASAWEQA